MKYISTRGAAGALNFEEAVLAGLASDGGLYVPEHIPAFSMPEIAALHGLSYPDLAYQIISRFTGNMIAAEALIKIIKDSYSQFRHAAIAPLKQLDSQLYLLELFHGPTLAFKDFALQFLGRLLGHILEQKKQKIVVIGATSGDTGSAAIHGCAGRGNMEIFILHPKGRVSEVQRRQMTTISEKNVHNLAVAGTFDDCQNIVKSLFADSEFCNRHHLTAVNSINWARIMAQIVYYFYSALALGAPARTVNFCVPTGNFGDIYAGYIAKKLGLPIGKLIIATNKNDILARTMKTGIYSASSVSASLSPSMDIQISSNFERLLFDLHERNGAKIKSMMQDFNAKRTLTLEPAAYAQLQREFASFSCSDEQTLTTIENCYKTNGELLDPHTAVALHAATQFTRGNGSNGKETQVNSQNPTIILATAHPAKFPDSVKKATGKHPELPAHLADLFSRRETMNDVENNAASVKSLINNINNV